MKILVTGAGGQLGHDLEKVLTGHELRLLGKEKLDVTDFPAVINAVTDFQPRIVIHAAAYTNVDGCETEPALAYKVNAIGTQNMAISCQEEGAAMVYVSTDFVFDGCKDTPYTEFDETNPISVYGRSKLAGERYVSSLLNKYFIVRTAWLYGREGQNFVKTILRLAGEQDELRVVSDQIGCPTSSLDVARKIAEIIETEGYGLYHTVNTGSCSWFDFGREILRLAGVEKKVIPIGSADLNRPAPRPAYSVLKNYSLELRGFKQLRPWQEALADYFNDEN